MLRGVVARARRATPARDLDLRGEEGALKRDELRRLLDVSRPPSGWTSTPERAADDRGARRARVWLVVDGSRDAELDELRASRGVARRERLEPLRGRVPLPDAVARRRHSRRRTSADDSSDAMRPSELPASTTARPPPPFTSVGEPRPSSSCRSPIRDGELVHRTAPPRRTTRASLDASQPLDARGLALVLQYVFGCHGSARTLGGEIVTLKRDEPVRRRAASDRGVSAASPTSRRRAGHLPYDAERHALALLEPLEREAATSTRDAASSPDRRTSARRTHSSCSSRGS